MSAPDDVGEVAAQPPDVPPVPPADPWRALVRWVATSNPFYVVSAGLFLAGLRASVSEHMGEQFAEAAGLMAGLAAYTLLLAVTGGLLVRAAGVWDDARTVLLLVVLMFLATSVTFDHALVHAPRIGVGFALTGLAFAVAVTEALLRAIRVSLPVGFRLPYHLALGLFFLYPVGLSALVQRGRPADEPQLWGLYGFAPAAGLVALTLLPAARRGPGYVRGNGSPWAWPYYPWSLFAFLGVAVVGRSLLLCRSFHLLEYVDVERSVFGPHFLVPLGFAAAVLLLEVGLRPAYRADAADAALLVPGVLAILAGVGHRADPVYQRFLTLYEARLGGTPLYLTIAGAAMFYGYAVVRRAPRAADGLTAALVALAFAAPTARTVYEFGRPTAWPLAAAAAVQLAVGLWRRDGARSLAGAGGLVAVAAAGTPSGVGVPAAVHLTIAGLLAVGAAFDDLLGRVLRWAGAVSVVAAAGGVVVGWAAGDPRVSVGVAVGYPPAAAVVLAGYGWLTGFRPAVVLAAVVPGLWAVAGGWLGYVALRAAVAGLDYLLLSLAVFAAAVAVSLGKSAVRPRWPGRPRRPTAA